jgi:hypothetical protein
MILFDPAAAQPAQVTDSRSPAFIQDQVQGRLWIDPEYGGVSILISPDQRARWNDDFDPDEHATLSKLQDIEFRLLWKLQKVA